MKKTAPMTDGLCSKETDIGHDIYTCISYVLSDKVTIVAMQVSYIYIMP